MMALTIALWASNSSDSAPDADPPKCGHGRGNAVGIMAKVYMFVTLDPLQQGLTVDFGDVQVLLLLQSTRSLTRHGGQPHCTFCGDTVDDLTEAKAKLPKGFQTALRRLGLILVLLRGHYLLASFIVFVPHPLSRIDFFAVADIFEFLETALCISDPSALCGAAPCFGKPVVSKV